jgi:hypothetical protein
VRNAVALMPSWMEVARLLGKGSGPGGSHIQHLDSPECFSEKGAVSLCFSC